MQTPIGFLLFQLICAMFENNVYVNGSFIESNVSKEIDTWWRKKYTRTWILSTTNRMVIELPLNWGPCFDFARAHVKILRLGLFYIGDSHSATTYFSIFMHFSIALKYYHHWSDSSKQSRSRIYTLEYRSTHEFLISESYQNQQSCAVSNYFGQRYFLDTTSFLKVVVLHFLPVVYW